LPIPSYARVTNLSNGARVIVRINDRGPFHSSRVIDLSYTAALKLGYLGSGSSELEVERLLPEDIARINAERLAQAPSAADPPVALALPARESRSTVQKPIEPAAAPLLVNTGSDATITNSDVASGYYLQLGAFGEAGNAEAVRSRLMRKWDDSLPPLEVSYVGVFYRLHSGPFATRAEAANAAQKLQGLSEIKAMIVQR
jgi:rare lipoprotein A